MRQMNFIKSILLTIVVAVTAALPSWGQEYEVASFELAPKDLTARTGKPRIDGNGRKCAVLKVQVNDRITAALGNVVGEITNMGMEKWIYVAHDTKQLELAFDNHYPLTLTFEDYDFPTLSQQMVYVVRLREKTAASTAQKHPAPPRQQTVTSSQTLTQPQSPGASSNSARSSDEIRKEAIAAYKAKKYEQALPLFRQVSDDNTAQNYLGIMFQRGYGVSQDYAEAVRWYRKSAEQGNEAAQCNLGFMYEKGFGVGQDYAEAVRWYRKSAEQGISRAQNNLGVMHRKGLGVGQDYAEAVRWFRKAAEQGNSTAQYNLGVMYEHGYGVEQNDAEAVRWYRKSAEQGDVDAQYALGWRYYNGKGVPQDYREADKWIRMCAEQNDAKAQNCLGEMYFYGRGVPQDYAEAAKWYSKGADQGLSNAQFNLGWCYYHNQGVPQDRAKAIQWWRKAAAQGNENAKKELEKIGEL